MKDVSLDSEARSFIGRNFRRDFVWYNRLIGAERSWANDSNSDTQTYA
jgi:hypothetical protein